VAAERICTPTVETGALQALGLTRVQHRHEAPVY